MREHPREFELLVADAAWHAELRRAQEGCHDPDYSMMAYNFEADPFAWKTDAPASRADVWFAWRWYAGGAVQYDKVLVRLDNSLRSQVLLPLHLMSDDALLKKLQASAIAETKYSCCPCKYLGKWTGDGYEPDPNPMRNRGSQRPRAELDRVLARLPSRREQAFTGNDPSGPLDRQMSVCSKPFGR